LAVTVTGALPPHFFRHESGRLVTALVRVFGVHNLALAEDVAQETLCRALEVWKISGSPEHPSAWLLAAAKNRAIDMLRRERTARTYAPELGRLLESEWTLVPTVEEIFEPRALEDDELRMMFSVCQPSLSQEAQIALALHILCGFSVEEIAAAFFSSTHAIEKRISRAKATLAESRRLFDLDDAGIAFRLGTVESAIYLLFNEGYHGASPESAVREDLCREALRLVTLLAEHPRTRGPSTTALAALLFLHASRLPARVSSEGELRSLFDQDRSQWDRERIAKGLAFLEQSAEGAEITEYHVEAAIAAHHACAARREDTPWRDIVSLYDVLVKMRPSPVVALSRAIAIAEAEGPERGLEEIAAIEGAERLATYPFYEAARAELYLRKNQRERARQHFLAAQKLARSAMERSFFESRAKLCADPEGA
jgi:RNA polymerase sigma-70 factor (ECF subfamily)